MAKQSECDTGNLSLGINSMISILKQYAESKVKGNCVQRYDPNGILHWDGVDHSRPAVDALYTAPPGAAAAAHILPHSPSDAAHPSGGCPGEFIGSCVCNNAGKFN